MIPIQASVPESPRGTSEPVAAAVPHYLFLDGMRGLAALWVVLFHMQGVVVQSLASGRLHGEALPQPITALFGYGHDAVAVFIVLSGFCLSLPVFRASGAELRGGIPEFFRRRARRLLPAYYAAVVLGLLSALSWYAFQSHQMQLEGTGIKPTVWLDMFRPGMLISHLLLIQNWSPVWNTGINPALWSLAVEWQIYFVFALLLLPLWRGLARRLGGAAAMLLVVAASFVLGYAPQIVLPAAHNGDWGCPWLLALFGLGMAAAWIASQDVKNKAENSRTTLYFVSMTVLVAALAAVRSVSVIAVKCTDPAVGLATISLILLCASRPAPRPALPAWGRTAIRGILEWRPLLLLGTVSYSLYLTHGYILVPVRFVLMRLHLGAATFETAAYGAAAGIAVLLASVFYRAFEKPFLSGARNAVSNGAFGRAAKTVTP